MKGGSGFLHPLKRVVSAAKFYEIHRAGEEILWYDPFEHPGVSELASTFPHHKHVPPDLRHNRVPAPGTSFDQPNLPYLIEELERTILSGTASPARKSNK